MKRPPPLRLAAGILAGVAGFGGLFHVATSTRLGRWAFNRCTLRVVNASGGPIEQVRVTWRHLRSGSSTGEDVGTVDAGRTREIRIHSKGLVGPGVEYVRGGRVWRRFFPEDVGPGGVGELRIE